MFNLVICSGCGKLRKPWKRFDKKEVYCLYCCNRMNMADKALTPDQKTRKRIKPLSLKRKEANLEYSRVRRRYLYEHPQCEAKIPGLCTGEATEIHHKRGRSGNLLSDTKYFCAICRGCHSWLHDHPKQAVEIGLIIKKHSNGDREGRTPDGSEDGSIHRP